ncbi:hypothetical protein KEJ39_08960 [Candidatus Bathyarchaeota archaeon]|nr:hypothetical protein [Candidatus Bathyarchaeota archaeon]
MDNRNSILKAARLMVTVGAIIMIVLGLLSILGRALSLPFYPPANISAIVYVLVSLVAGIAALLLSPKTGVPQWTLILIVIGIVGGGLGGLLVLIGGVAALIAKLT